MSFKTSGVLLILIFFFSCDFVNKTESRITKSSMKKMDTVNRVEPVKRDSTVDYTARFIAGMTQVSDNSLSAYENKEYWKKHSRTSEENWKKLTDERLNYISDWEKNTFRKWKSDTLPLFYPFSGPDFVHAVYLYPNTTRYIFAALEPVTELPDLEQLNDGNRKIFLQSVENSLRDIYDKSYFITTHMASDFRYDKAKGVLPVFYVFMVRSGFEILDVQPVAIDSTGVLHDTIIKKKKTNWVSGVKFSFRAIDSDTIRELYYYNVDVSDNGLKRTTGFTAYLESMGEVNTFIKSASYLLHYSTFSVIRNYILANSRTIFQDDTGIPYKWFKTRTDYKTILFGEYTRPVKDFGDYVFQEDLDSLYNKSNSLLSLPFHLGYHWGDKKQSQQLFIRK